MIKHFRNVKGAKLIWNKWTYIFNDWWFCIMYLKNALYAIKIEGCTKVEELVTRILTHLIGFTEVDWARSTNDEKIPLRRILEDAWVQCVRAWCKRVCATWTFLFPSGHVGLPQLGLLVNDWLGKVFLRWRICGSMSNNNDTPDVPLTRAKSSPVQLNMC